MQQSCTILVEPAVVLCAESITITLAWVGFRRTGTSNAAAAAELVRWPARWCRQFLQVLAALPRLGTNGEPGRGPALARYGPGP